MKNIFGRLNIFLATEAITPCPPITTPLQGVVGWGRGGGVPYFFRKNTRFPAILLESV